MKVNKINSSVSKLMIFIDFIIEELYKLENKISLELYGI